MKALSIICFCGTIMNTAIEIYCIVTASDFNSFEAKANRGNIPEVYIW